MAQCRPITGMRQPLRQVVPSPSVGAQAWLADQGVKAPPELAGEERLAWWVDELDAVRGDAPRGDASDDDLPDPHEGIARHEVVLPRLASAVETLAGVLA